MERFPVLSNNTPLYEYLEKLGAPRASANMNEIQDLVNDMDNISSDEEMKEFMVKLFDISCSIESIQCYFAVRLKSIESTYGDDLKNVLDKTKENLNKSDANTFQIIRTTLIGLYRDICNINNGCPQTIQLPCTRTITALKYENGILIPVLINSYQIIRNPNFIGRLLVYVFTILHFYDALLWKIDNPTDDNDSNVLALRFIYYLMRMLLSENEVEIKNSTFLHHIAQIFFLLEIEIDSILFLNIERRMSVEAHGDLIVNDRSNGDLMKCLYGRIIFKKHFF